MDTSSKMLGNVFVKFEDTANSFNFTSNFKVFKLTRLQSWSNKTLKSGLGSGHHGCTTWNHPFQCLQASILSALVVYGRSFRTNLACRFVVL